MVAVDVILKIFTLSFTKIVTAAFVTLDILFPSIFVVVFCLLTRVVIVTVPSTVVLVRIDSIESAKLEYIFR